MAYLLKKWFLRVNSRRYRRIAIACIATAVICISLLSTVLFVRWRSSNALQGDTEIVLGQAREQLIRTFQSRRGTLTLLRDTLDRSADIKEAERKTLARSAVAHTRHLIGIGLQQQNKPAAWWINPSPATSNEISQIERALSLRSKLKNVWKFPSTLTTHTDDGRIFLIMLEPLKSSINKSSAIIGVFDLKPLLSDFFELILKQPYPVRLTENSGEALYESNRWKKPAKGQKEHAISKEVKLDALLWNIGMQPGKTQVVKTMSAFKMLLASLSIISGFAMIVLIWLMAMRTWILQRAVSRRTAALRRTMERLRQLATTDELTGVYNRRFFLERWEREYERAKRYDRPLACLMIDVDQFKRINDMMGHHIGDILLKKVAEGLKFHLRQTDILARFGGDEFIVALPETNEEQALNVAYKLREVCIDGPWTKYKNLGSVRLSVGIGDIRKTDSSVQDIIQRADADLYAFRKAERQKAAQTNQKKVGVA